MSVEHPLNVFDKRFEILTPCYMDMQVLSGILGRMRTGHRLADIIRALLLHYNFNYQQRLLLSTTCSSYHSLLLQNTLSNYLSAKQNF